MTQPQGQAQRSNTLRLGPFTGGLNIGSDPVLIADNELMACTNFELDVDGALVSRPAIQVTFQGGSNERLLIFGSVVFSGVLYLFATRNGGTYVSSNAGSSWTQLNPGGLSRECKTMEVYNNAVWLPATPGSANGGMSWTVAGGAVAVAAMPRAEKCVVHKNRLYVVPGETGVITPSTSSRLTFSQSADFNTWPGTNFIDVQPGDGDTLNNIIVYQDNLLLFKGESTHVLAYDLDPVDAILRETNPVVGTTGSFGVVQYENTVYCMHRNKVYEINNFNFTLINVKVPPVFDNALPTGTTVRYEAQHISLLGERLIVRYYNRTYSFQLRTRTWSEWTKTDSTSTIEWHIFGPLVRARDLTGSGLDAYYTGYSFDVSSGGYKVIKIIDGRASGSSEGTGTHKFHCIATTKNYDMADPVRYKRLFWWGADVITGEEVTGSITPITLVSSVTWDALTTETWADLGTWGSPIIGSVAYQEVIPGDDITNTNKLIKFGKSMRFRKANFSMRMETNGTPAQPTKIFQYTAIVGIKQLVSARAS
jgi:hypothetical protein